MPDPSPTAQLQGRRILVVEDTMLVAEVLTDMLQEYGCDVVGPVPRLAKALSCAKHEQLDGALLDVNLAGEKCFPVASLLAMREIPFAFLSGYGETGIPPEFRGVPRLTKPVNMNELVRFVCNMLDGEH